MKREKGDMTASLQEEYQEFAIGIGGLFLCNEINVYFLID